MCVARNLTPAAREMCQRNGASDVRRLDKTFGARTLRTGLDMPATGRKPQGLPELRKIRDPKTCCSRQCWPCVVRVCPVSHAQLPSSFPNSERTEKSVFLPIYSDPHTRPVYKITEHFDLCSIRAF